MNRSSEAISVEPGEPGRLIVRFAYRLGMGLFAP